MVDAMESTIKMHERHPGGGRQYKLHLHYIFQSLFFSKVHKKIIIKTRKYVQYNGNFDGKQIRMRLRWKSWDSEKKPIRKDRKEKYIQKKEITYCRKKMNAC